MRDGLRRALADAHSQGDAEGRTDLDAIIRRAPVRRTTLPESDRAARFAQAIEDIYEGRDWPMREP
mgnify:CR=1 FL=1